VIEEMERKLKSIVLSIVVFAVLFGLIAPVQAQPYTITVEPETAELFVGDTQVFTATVCDAFDVPIRNVNIIWLSTNETVGTVSPTTAITGADGTATTTFTALTTGTTTILANNGTVFGFASVTVGQIPTPTVSITTDSFEYCPGDTMTITIDIANPTEASVTFQWYWCVPQFSVCVPVMSVPIPAGYEDTHDFSFTIPDWGSTPFGNVFYVQLLDTSGEVLDADAACWAYSPGREAMPIGEVEIAKEIKKTIEMIE
jgi:hypothetical protein